MKIIHTSDIHLDSPLTARLTPSAAKERKRELVASFRQLIDDAVNISADAVIIAGDLFDNEKVTERTLESVMGFIEGAKGVTFFYLTGNHEKDRLLSSGVSLPENLKIFGEDWTYFKLGGHTVAGRSTVAEGMFSSLVLDKADTNIVVLHGELSEYSGKEKIAISEFSHHPIDYLALGHYHTYSERRINDRTVAVYSGTPEGRGFDETGDKGYVLIDTSGERINSRLIKRAMRTLHLTEVDITGANKEIEIENRVSYAISQIDSRDLIRVVLTGEHEPEVKRDTESLKERFASRYFYLEVKDESRLRISAEDYKNDKSLKGEFIRLVMAKEALSDEEKAAVIECGLRALAGEAI